MTMVTLPCRPYLITCPLDLEILALAVTLKRFPCFVSVAEVSILLIFPIMVMDCFPIFSKVRRVGCPFLDWSYKLKVHNK